MRSGALATFLVPCFHQVFNSMLDSNSETLRRVMKADLHLASFDNSCWSAQVSNAFNGLQGSAMFKQKMLRITQVPMQEFICDLRFRHLKVWREADFSCPRAVNKEAVTYHKWCGSSEGGPRGDRKRRNLLFLSPPTCTRIWTNMC